MQRLPKLFAVLPLLAVLGVASPAAAEIDWEQTGANTLDVLVIRPLSVAQLLVGSFAMVMYPITAWSGSGDDMIERLVEKPMYSTFERKLGDI